MGVLERRFLGATSKWFRSRLKRIKIRKNEPKVIGIPRNPNPRHLFWHLSTDAKYASTKSLCIVYRVDIDPGPAFDETRKSYAWACLQRDAAVGLRVRLTRI